uniref:Uncharacterized protein n=1 Tax=Arundo donax TaxID=35708 RepID=A0A0A9CPB5_ARUDO
MSKAPMAKPPCYTLLSKKLSDLKLQNPRKLKKIKSETS